MEKLLNPFKQIWTGLTDAISKWLISLRWKYVMSKFHPFDFFFLLVLIYGVIYGTKKGFFKMLILILEFLLVVWLVMGNYWAFSHVLNQYVYVIPEKYTPITAFFFIFPVIWASVMIIDMILQSTIGSWIKAEAASGLNVGGGGFLGFFYAVMIFALVFKGLTLQPDALTSRFLSGGSISALTIKNLPDHLYDGINDSIVQIMRLFK